jgi:hypothetical protein
MDTHQKKNKPGQGNRIQGNTNCTPLAVRPISTPSSNPIKSNAKAKPKAKRKARLPIQALVSRTRWEKNVGLNGVYIDPYESSTYLVDPANLFVQGFENRYFNPGCQYEHITDLEKLRIDDKDTFLV